MFNFTKTQALPLVIYFGIFLNSHGELYRAGVSNCIWIWEMQFRGGINYSGNSGSDQKSLFLKERLIATLRFRWTLRFPWYLSCLAIREYTRIESSLYCKSSPTLLMVIQTYAKMFNCLIWLYYFRDWMLSPDATQRILGWHILFFE